MMRRQDLDVTVPAGGIAPGLPRVGIIVPRSNTVCERELVRLGAAQFDLHATRMRFAAGAEPADPQAFYLDALREPVADLAFCGVEVMALACTTAAMSCDHSALHAAMVGGAGTLLVSECIVAALRETGARRIALFSPYTPASNDGIVGFLARHGFETVTATGLGLNVSPERFRPVSRLAPDYIAGIVRGMDLAGAECLFLSCSDMPTLEVMAPLEREFGIPVVSTNGALHRAIERACPSPVIASRPLAAWQSRA